MKKLILVLLLLSSIGNAQKNDSVVDLPEDISQINNEELSRIADYLGDAKIIGTTERIHGYKEPFIFRNELIKYLVETKRIDIILLESGFLESRYLNDFIHSKSNDLERARINGFSSGKQTIPENIEILNWLRNYNSKNQNQHKINIFGFDVSGSMGAGSSNSEMNTPIKHLISYLERTSFKRDSSHIYQLKFRIDSLKIKPFSPDQTKLATYDKLNQITRDHITSIINDLISNLETYRYEYIEQTSVENYKWAYISAIAARQIDNILRKLPLPGEQMTPEKIDNSFYARLNGMVENVEYLLSQNPNAKFFIFGASNHLFKTPAETYWPGSQEPVSLPITVGTYLAHQYPDNYKLISHFYLNAENEKRSLKQDQNIFSNILNLNSKNYFLPIKGLNKPDITNRTKIDHDNYLIPEMAFDYILFTENITEHQRKR